MQAAGGDVRAAAELAAGVQLGGDDLDAGQPGLRLLVGRDAAAVVVHLDRAVGVQRDLDPVRGAGERLVDAVVDDLPQAVHEPAGVGRADVHPRPLADRLEPLEDEEVGCVVGVVGDGAAPGVGPGAGRSASGESTRDTPYDQAGTLPVDRPAAGLRVNRAARGRHDDLGFAVSNRAPDPSHCVRA